MNTLLSLDLLPCINRRRQVPKAQKPRIRKLIGVDTWVCHVRGLPRTRPGFGLSPAKAYNDWKRKQC
jgi:hypothetical protein